MSRRSLAVVLATATVLLLLALLVPGGLGAACRLLIALPLVLVLPGYAVTAAVFPRRGLGAPEMIVLSLGLSLAILVLAGLVLSLMPWGMGTVPWGVFLGIMALVAAVGWWRRGHRPAALTGRAIAPPARRTAVPIAAAALIVLAAIRVAAVGEAQQPQVGFTQLWILPASPGGSTTALQLGLTSREPVTTSYIVRLSTGGRTLQSWTDLSVAPGRTWQATVPLPSGLPASGKVEATLFRTKFPQTIYRRAWLEHDT